MPIGAALIGVEYDEREARQLRSEREADRMGRHLPTSEPDPDLSCVDCGGPGWATLKAKQLAQTVEEMEQEKTKRICSPCAVRRCLANAEGRIAMVREAMEHGNDIEMVRSATEGANWFNAIEEMLP